VDSTASLYVLGSLAIGASSSWFLMRLYYWSVQISWWGLFPILWTWSVTCLCLLHSLCECLSHQWLPWPDLRIPRVSLFCLFGSILVFLWRLHCWPQLLRVGSTTMYMRCFRTDESAFSCLSSSLTLFHLDFDIAFGSEYRRWPMSGACPKTFLYGVEPSVGCWKDIGCVYRHGVRRGFAPKVLP